MASCTRESHQIGKLIGKQIPKSNAINTNPDTVLPPQGEFIYLAIANPGFRGYIEIDPSGVIPPGTIDLANPAGTVGNYYFMSFSTSQGIFTSQSILNLTGPYTVTLYDSTGHKIGNIAIPLPLPPPPPNSWTETEMTNEPTGRHYEFTCNPSQDCIVIMDNSIGTTVDN
jgi:hypothetical protein